MVGDFYTDKWRKIGPLNPLNPFDNGIPNSPHVNPQVSREEFEMLRREVLDMKELLKRAVKYDEETNQRGCEVEEKIKLLKQVADMVGVDLNDVLGK
jgi:hypothetical protein